MTRNEHLNHPLVLLAEKIAAEANPEQFYPSSVIPDMPHPRRVARLVATLDGVNEVDVAAALLHDVLDDTPVTAPALGGMLLAGGGAQDAVALVVGLVQELAKPYSSDSGLRRMEKRLKDIEKVKRMSDRAKRIKLCDTLDTLINGQPMTPARLVDYLAECKSVVDICGDVDPPLAGWLLREIDKRRNAGAKEG